jgi:hypothetical protein
MYCHVSGVCVTNKTGFGSLTLLSSSSEWTLHGNYSDFQLNLPELNCQFKVKVNIMLRLTVGPPVCLGAKHPSGDYDQNFITCVTVTVLFLWGALSDERSGLSFVYAAGPCQRSLSRVRVHWDLRPYFTVSDLRLPFSSPPTTRRFTMEVFDPASTRVSFSSSDFALL